MHTEIYFAEYGKALTDYEYIVDLHDSRPFLQGKPLSAEPSAILPKPNWLIDLGAGGENLTLTARRLLNLLLALSWNYMKDPEEDFFFVAYSSEIRRAIGQKTAKDNAQLEAALFHLVSTCIEFPKLQGGYFILDDYEFSADRQHIWWRFNPELREVLSVFTPWGWTDLSESLKLTSKYALALYEHVSLRANLKRPVFNATPDDLRLHLGAGPSLSTWQAFKSRALEPAIRQINEKTQFTVSVSYERSRRSNAVTKINMTIKRGRKPRLH